MLDNPNISNQQPRYLKINILESQAWKNIRFTSKGRAESRLTNNLRAKATDKETDKATTYNRTANKADRANKANRSDSSCGLSVVVCQCEFIF